MNTLGLCLNVERFAPSQYAGYDFDSMCVFGGNLLLANENGIFTSGGDKDNTTDIEAFFETMSSDFGTKKEKRIRQVELSGYFEGDIDVSIITDGDTKKTYSIASIPIDTYTISQQTDYDNKGNYIGIKVANSDGADFSVDAIYGLLSILNLHHRSGLVLGRGSNLLPELESVATGS